MNKKDELQARIVLVTNSANEEQDLRQLLLDEGYVNIELLKNTQETLWFLQNNFYDLAILDGDADSTNSLELIQNLKYANQLPSYPCIFMLSQKYNYLKLPALKIGVEYVIEKPIDKQEFFIYIKNLLHFNLSSEEMMKKTQDLSFFYRKRSEELAQSHLEIIYKLAHAAEYKDDVTGSHIIRVSEYCRLLGRAYGLSETEGNELFHAAHLHDIGKIGIPDDILLKKGTLTVEEFEIMKQHPLIGANILSNSKSSVLETARLISLSHHEKWDGSGYPYGLEKENIPLVGRITAIADVFDALISRRPYREPWSVEKSLNMLQMKSGRHFDPELVELFIAQEEKVTQIKEYYEKNPPHH